MQPILIINYSIIFIIIKYHDTNRWLYCRTLNAQHAECLKKKYIALCQKTNMRLVTNFY